MNSLNMLVLVLLGFLCVACKEKTNIQKNTPISRASNFNTPVPSGIKIREVVMYNLETYLAVGIPDEQIHELAHIIPGLFQTPRGAVSPPPGLQWRIEIWWRSDSGMEDYLKVYVTNRGQIVDVEGAHDKVGKLQKWVSDQLK